MKKLLAILFVAVFMISCNQEQKHPIDNNPMSGYILGEDSYTESVREFMKSYTDNNMEDSNSIFAEGAVFSVNSNDLSVSEFMSAFGSGHNYFDNISHEDLDIATMYYNDGKIFTNVWYNWTGNLKSTGETLKEKGYGWFEWENDKVIKAYNAFDPTAYNAAIASQIEN
tara:strand:- start:464 stop:970 length:507 start_codon:yes stop_codon:yes gene_type:complete